MIFNWNGDITNDKFQKLIDTLDLLKVKEVMIIYLNSDGGDAEVMEALIHVINNNADRLSLIGYGKLYSAAFDVFFQARCQRDVLRGTVGMCHHMRIGMEISKSNEYHGEDKANKDLIMLQRLHAQKMMKDMGMKNTEILRINKGEDVYFQTPRLLQFLKNINGS